MSKDRVNKIAMRIKKYWWEILRWIQLAKTINYQADVTGKEPWN